MRGSLGSLGIVGLGLVASGKRKIVSGREWEGLYNTSKLLGTNPYLGNDLSDTYDTLNFMAKIVRDTLIDTAKVATKLKGKTLEETLRNDWNHVYNNFQYEKDAINIEQIRRPAKSFVDRKKGIDCDCMSVVLSSLLHHQGITHAFRKTAYTEETGWQHVYVVVPKPSANILDFSGSKTIDRSKYYVLDCVVDKFNYEVPYLKKYDKIMRIQYLNGLDVAALNGGVTASLAAATPRPSSTDTLLAGFGGEFDALHAISGLGAVDSTIVENAFLKGLKQHLINTRSIVRLNPALTSGLYNPTLFAQRLDALIDAFDNPVQRDTVLGHLGVLEDRENGLNGTNGLGAFFKKVGSAVKKVGEGVKKVAKFVIKFNPATIAMRAGMLLAMKINLFRLAEKLGYGLWTEQQAKEKDFDMGQFKKAKSTLSKVVNIYKKLGGKQSKIESAIRSGWNHGVKKHNLIHGLDSISVKPSGKPNRFHAAKVAVAKVRIHASAPLLQLVNESLQDVNFQNVTRRDDTKSLDNFLQAVRTNQGGLATKLSLAYKPSAEASKYHRDEYAKLLKSASVVEGLVKEHGGNAQQLKEAVEAGKKVAITSSGLGVVAATTTASASTILATIASILKKVDFKSMFKGKADSPHFDASQMKNVSASEPASEDTTDEGDPSTTPEPVSKIVSDYTDTSAIVSKITTSPTAAAFTTLLPSKANDVVDKMSHEDAEKLLNQVKASPSVNAIANTPLAKALVKKVQRGKGKVKTATQGIQDAEVISSSPLQPDDKSAGMNKTVKYVAIAGGVTVGLYMLSKAFAPKPATAPAPAPAQSESLSGVKKKTKSKSKASRRPKKKKVMAITI